MPIKSFLDSFFKKNPAGVPADFEHPPAEQPVVVAPTRPLQGPLLQSLDDVRGVIDDDVAELSGDQVEVLVEEQPQEVVQVVAPDVRVDVPETNPLSLFDPPEPRALLRELFKN